MDSLLYTRKNEEKKEIMARKSTPNSTLKFMLTLCSIWPGTPYVLLCRVFWFVSLTAILFCHYRYFFMHIHSAELLDLMDCLSSFFAYSKIIIKFFVFWLNQRWVICFNLCIMLETFGKIITINMRSYHSSNERRCNSKP